MSKKYIVYLVGTEEFTIDISNISCIEEVSGITRVPKAPDYLYGITELRGEILPVIDMHFLFNIKEEDEVPTKLLVTEVSGKKMALLVDQVVEIISAEEKDVCEVPEMVKTEATEYIDGVVSKHGKLMICISAEKILSKTEQRNIDNAMKSMQ